jgi:hypothetical protein
MPFATAKDVIRSRLAGSLHFLDGQAAAPSDLNLAPEVAALAVALVSRSLRGPCWREGMRLTTLLSDLHAMPEGPARTALRQEAQSIAESLLRDDGVSEAFSKFLLRHGTRETVMMGILARPRRKGPVGPGEFSWLKAVDRPLWYALDNLGRQTFHVEGLAAMNHFRQETLAGSRLATPHVAEATEALAAIERRSRENPTTLGAGVSPDDIDEADDLWPNGPTDLDFGSFYGRRPPKGRT